MKAFSKFFVFLLLFSLSVSYVCGLAVSGKQTGFKLDFFPNHTQTNEFFVTNKEGYVSDYDIYAEHKQGADLTEYFTITPNRIEGVENGESARFNIQLNLPEEPPDVPGESRTWVRVKIDSSQGGFRAYPSIAISYYIFILYPFKYMEWELQAPNMNINESGDIVVRIENLGEPVINSAYADIEVINEETNQTVKNLRTNSAEIQPRAAEALRAEFNSKGLDPGNYKAIATLHWDENISEKTNAFRIGSKNVNILNFTKLFEVDAINKMDIKIESAWNTNIRDIYADITIYDNERGLEVAEFKSLNTELRPWETNNLIAYFDTSGLDMKEYNATVELNYEGSKTTAQDKIRIDQDIGAKTVEEIPGKFKLDFSGMFTTMNILIALLVFFIIVNVFLLMGSFKNKKSKKETDEKSEEEIEVIDDTVVKHIKELKKKYNDDYIRDMMVKKGWPKKKVEKVLDEAKK